VGLLDFWITYLDSDAFVASMHQAELSSGESFSTDSPVCSKRFTLF